MCRVEINEAVKNEIIAKEYLKEQLLGENEVFKFLINDAKTKNKHNVHNGYSVMLFGTQVGKVVNEGELFDKFFKNFKNLENIDCNNIGWELIYKKLFED
jgi:hypothetical protein